MTGAVVPDRRQRRPAGDDRAGARRRRRGHGRAGGRRPHARRGRPADGDPAAVALRLLRRQERLYDALFERGWRERSPRCGPSWAASDLAVPGRMRDRHATFVRWAVEHPAYAPLMFWRPVPASPRPSGPTPAVELERMAREFLVAMRSAGLLRRTSTSTWLPHPDRGLQRAEQSAVSNAPGEPFETGTFTLPPARRGGHVAGPLRRLPEPHVGLNPEGTAMTASTTAVRPPRPSWTGIPRAAGRDRVRPLHGLLLGTSIRPTGPARPTVRTGTCARWSGTCRHGPDGRLGPVARRAEPGGVPAGGASTP